MSKPIDEQLSAFLDDELPPAELDLLLRQMDREPQYRQTLARYSLLGEHLRAHHGQELRGSRLADRVAEAIAREDRPKARARAVWQQRVWMAGAAAALAGVMAVFIADPFSLRGQGPAMSDNAEAPEAAAAADLSISLANSTATRRLTPRAAERLTGYLVAHGAYTNEFSRSTIDSHLVAARAERASWSLPDSGGRSY